MPLKTHKVHGGGRGKLVALEGLKDVPFDIKRVFYIYGANTEQSRGEHSHFKIKQYLISVCGSCKVTLDNGVNKTTYTLDSPSKGLFQNSMLWGEMHDFTEDCVLLVLASEYYDENDYINDYQEFLKLVNR